MQCFVSHLEQEIPLEPLLDLVNIPHNLFVYMIEKLRQLDLIHPSAHQFRCRHNMIIVLMYYLSFCRVE